VSPKQQFKPSRSRNRDRETKMQKVWRGSRKEEINKKGGEKFMPFLKCPGERTFGSSGASPHEDTTGPAVKKCLREK